jgi:hypothetical protein
MLPFLNPLQLNCVMIRERINKDNVIRRMRIDNSTAIGNLSSRELGDHNDKKLKGKKQMFEYFRTPHLTVVRDIGGRRENTK